MINTPVPEVKGPRHPLESVPIRCIVQWKLLANWHRLFNGINIDAELINNKRYQRRIYVI